MRKFALVIAALSIGTGHTTYAQSNIQITFDQLDDISPTQEATSEELAQCIVEERKGMAKKFLKRRGDKKLVLLLPLIAAPCQPKDGSKLNVPLLENKLRELLNA